jgi:hydrogenase maturation protein HypF
MSELQNARIHITGIVQGVGFRPFVYNLAQSMRLVGWVRNTSAGVDIEVDGYPEILAEFIRALERDAPPLAHVDQVSTILGEPNGFSTFEIVHSEPLPQAFQPISPDVSICPDCLKELFDPFDRRYRYPFINCTNCGPRFTIITDIPYDRPNTTMAGFSLCPDCAGEYKNPLDRRFHAQPVACPVCGPHVWLESSVANKIPASNIRSESSSPGNEGYEPLSGEDAILDSQRRLADGQILAIKGLGGFHLACDATNRAAVLKLRERKLRVDKPFALMMPDIETVQQHCILGEAEREILLSRQRPILLLPKKPGSPIVSEVATNQTTLGVMLPYTPLHYLLFSPPFPGDSDQAAATSAPPLASVLVMTSGNLSEEPIATDNEEARLRLASLADAFLMHNRPIRTRCDDSVVRVIPRQGSPSLFPIRRSRGYAPSPIGLPWKCPPLLGAGPELKNTFCLTRDQYAFLSHHIGDMENYETLCSYEDSVAHYERLFRIHPEALAYDLHPNYLTTRYVTERAQKEGISCFGVQHHHAHIAACLTENKLPPLETVIGISFDGTGYGDDGAIWGGEFLLANCKGYKRVAHLEYMPLPGGDAAIRKPARLALAALWQAGLEWSPALPSVEAMSAEEKATVRAQLERGINTQLTSSIGRLFDTVAALAGVRQQINYEAQAAIEFENLVDPDEQGAYEFDLNIADGNNADKMMIIRPQPVLAKVVSECQAGVPISHIAARFHNGAALMVKQVSTALRSEYGISTVALSGGVWQNSTLLNKTISLLEADGMKVYVHHHVPTNDGGVSLGQAVVAAVNILDL